MGTRVCYSNPFKAVIYHWRLHKETDGTFQYPFTIYWLGCLSQQWESHKAHILWESWMNYCMLPSQHGEDVGGNLRILESLNACPQFPFALTPFHGHLRLWGRDGANRTSPWGQSRILGLPPRDGFLKNNSHTCWSWNSFLKIKHFLSLFLSISSWCPAESTQYPYQITISWILWKSHSWITCRKSA